jgi:hypothetical protein
MSRISLLIAGGSAILLLAMTGEGAVAQISNCQYRHPDGTICKARGDWPNYTLDRDCRCVHIRVIRGVGRPGAVEVRPPRNTIKGGQHPDGPPGSVEVRGPD